MRMILGLDAPTQGSVTVGGRSYRDLPAPMREVGALLDAKALHGGRRARDHLLCLAQSNGIPRRPATLSRPTMRSTSSTRLRGMPLLWARHSRWSRARRPPCSALASRRAPTSRMGAGRSR